VILFFAGFLAEVMTITPPPARSRSLSLPPLTVQLTPLAINCKSLDRPSARISRSKEAIVDSLEADVENQSSAMQRTRLS
jgi:hypothetical protein